jgi:ketosteroid isomerase-like protein
MDNRKIIQEVLEAFDKSDVDTILSFLSEDVTWNMVGDQVITGKEGMRDFFAANGGTQMVSSTKEHIIVDGNNVSVNGEVTCKTKDGDVFDMYYCDLYELDNGLIKNMASYIINKK